MLLQTLLLCGAVVVAGMALAFCRGAAGERPRMAYGGDPGRGAAHMRTYGCGSCHTIPGVAGARSLAGPPLWAMGERAYIAGVLPNTPEHLTRWIQDPPAVNPLTAMPGVGVTDEHARDIAAYLFTLREQPALITPTRWFARREPPRSE